MKFYSVRALKYYLNEKNLIHGRVTATISKFSPQIFDTYFKSISIKISTDWPSKWKNFAMKLKLKPSRNITVSQASNTVYRNETYDKTIADRSLLKYPLIGHACGKILL